MAPKQSNAEPYGFAAKFERAIATTAASRPRFWGRLAAGLDPQSITDTDAKRALLAVAAIATETGTGPDSAVLVVQRLRRWQHDGKVTYEDVVAVSTMFDEAEDAGLPSEESLVAEAVPVLQRRMHFEAIKEAMEEHKRGGDFVSVEERLARARTLGEADASAGTSIGRESFRLIEAAGNLDHLPTGVQELDVFMDGGLSKGASGLVLAGSGSGKSMFLSHVGAEAMRNGLCVAYAALELTVPEVAARLMANLTNIPILGIKNSKASREACEKRLDSLPVLGACEVKAFTPDATTVQDIIDWAGEVAEKKGREVDLMLIDYVDLMNAPKKGDKEVSTYTSGKIITNGLRVWNDKRGKWLWTASQTTGREEASKVKRVDLHHVAESMNKVRGFDVVLGQNKIDDDGAAASLMEWFVAKNRFGAARRNVGPVPADFSVGRLAPIINDPFHDKGGAKTPPLAEDTGWMLSSEEREPGSDG